MFAYSCNSFQVFLGVFSQVFHKYVSSVSTAFSRMLQLLFFYVSKVDRVLCLSSCFFCCLTLVPSLRRSLGMCHPHPLSLDADDVWGGPGPMWVHIHRRAGD